MNLQTHYDFFQNRDCEYFPCHPGADPETFSCLFCYCPLYCLGDRCGGNFTYTDSGVKDCTHCLRPHRRENYGSICNSMSAVLELAKKKREKS
ncbi:MAG: cysteine-rich small domain-containing protein [Eubacteriales bacterium]|nr:cysteine-rich small domain-containing protein [Eubacteriales bacterium]